MGPAEDQRRRLRIRIPVIPLPGDPDGRGIAAPWAGRRKLRNEANFGKKAARERRLTVYETKPISGRRQRRSAAPPCTERSQFPEEGSAGAPPHGVRNEANFA